MLLRIPAVSSILSDTAGRPGFLGRKAGGGSHNNLPEHASDLSFLSALPGERVLRMNVRTTNNCFQHGPRGQKHSPDMEFPRVFLPFSTLAILGRWQAWTS